MITAGFDIINAMLPHVSAATTGENASDLRKAASDKRIHHDGVASETPFHFENQGERKHDKGNENEYADDTVHGACDAEEVHLLSVGNKAPYTTESV